MSLLAVARLGSADAGQYLAGGHLYNTSRAQGGAQIHLGPVGAGDLADDSCLLATVARFHNSQGLVGDGAVHESQYLPLAGYLQRVQP